MTDNSIREELAKESQKVTDGVGTVFERRYWIDFQNPQIESQALMDDIKLNVEEYAPGLLADFDKTVGSERQLSVGDQFSIRILGPWNGDVRVTDVQDMSFTLQTLEGHPEAGHITFSLTPHAEVEGAWHFEIRSLASSRDGLVSLSYDKLGVGKKVQEKVWTTFCERVLERSGGQALGAVGVETFEVCDTEDLQPSESGAQ